MARKPKAFADGQFVDLQQLPASGVEGERVSLETEITYPARDYRQQPVRLRRKVHGYVEAPPEPLPDPVVGTAEYVRTRMAEAMQILKRLPYGKTDRPSTRTSAALPVVHSAVEAYGHWMPEVKNPPTAAEIDRMDECLAWLWWVPAEWRKAVAGVACEVPLRRIATRMRCSHEHVRRLERKGIERIARRVRGRC